MIQRPDWTHWTQMPHAELWECVALSCDIEPRKTDMHNLGLYGIDARAAKQKASYDDHKIRVETYQSRVDIAVARLNSGDQLQTIDVLPGDPRKWHVSLPEFVQWAVFIMKWKDMPPELVEFARTPDSQSAAPRTMVSRATPDELKILTEASTDSVKSGLNSQSWIAKAREYGKEIRGDPKNKHLNVERIADKVHERMKKEKIVGRGNRVPTAGTIKRHALTGIKS